MLWRHLLVLHVLVDGASNVIKIFFEEFFISRAFAVGASCQEEQGKYYDRVGQPWSDLQVLYLQAELRTRRLS